MPCYTDSSFIYLVFTACFDCIERMHRVHACNPLLAEARDYMFEPCMYNSNLVRPYLKEKRKGERLGTQPSAET